MKLTSPVSDKLGVQIVGVLGDTQVTVGIEWENSLILTAIATEVIFPILPLMPTDAFIYHARVTYDRAEKRASIKSD